MKISNHRSAFYALLLTITIGPLQASERSEWKDDSDSRYKEQHEKHHKAGIQVVDKKSRKAVRGAIVIIDGKSKKTGKRGIASIRGKHKDTATVTVLYQSAGIPRLTSFHDINLRQGVTVLPVENAKPVQQLAKFSFNSPFGAMPSGTRWSSILPQLATDVSGPRMGIFDGIRLNRDQLQKDGLLSLMMVAYDDSGLPFKYGYMLDKNPDQINKQYLQLSAPFATEINEDVIPFHWQKMPDSLNASGENDSCDMQFPPYVACGFFMPNQGIFSWMNVSRKGIEYSTPGAFLPARSAGANPLMVLPDSMIELVGHDDPIGMGNGANFSRHRFVRFASTPDEVVSLHMPELLVGEKMQSGEEAIEMDYVNGQIQVNWMLASSGGHSEDLENMDYAKLELIWPSARHEANLIWQHYFEPVSGMNELILPLISRNKKAIALPAIAEINDATLHVYGSNGVKGYDQAIELMQAGVEPNSQGNNAFEISRWR